MHSSIYLKTEVFYSSSFYKGHIKQIVQITDRNGTSGSASPIPPPSWIISLQSDMQPGSSLVILKTAHIKSAKAPA